MIKYQEGQLLQGNKGDILLVLQAEPRAGDMPLTRCWWVVKFLPSGKKQQICLLEASMSRFFYPIEETL